MSTPQPNRRVANLHRHLTSPSAAAVSEEGGPTLKASEVKALNGKQLKESYDFIVCGGGSAGCVAAARLSENPSVSVLLIEAGNSNQARIVRSPMVQCADLQQTERDWMFRSEVQPNMNDKVSFWPRGKTLGGCSSINFMLYVRGDPRTFDFWSKEMGCLGWSWHDVLPMFMKSERLANPNSKESSHQGYADLAVHGTDGPLTVTDMSCPNQEFPTRESVNAFLAGCEEAGLPKNIDYNGNIQTGAATAQVTLKDGVRADTASAFLFAGGALERPNLTVLIDTHVTKVVMQGSTAVGVNVKLVNAPLNDTSNANTKKAHTHAGAPTTFIGCTKEVVVSAGTVGSPWILLLSGIGPQWHLNDVGVPLVKDLPVGESMFDHLMAPVVFEAKSNVHSGFSDRIVDAISNGWAMLTRSAGMFMYPWIHAVAFSRSGLNPENIGNDIQLHFQPFFIRDPNKTFEIVGLPLDQQNQSMADVPTSYGVTIYATLLFPQSQGYIRLKSRDPLEYPVVQPNYFTHPKDMPVMIEAVKLARKVGATPAFKRMFKGEVFDKGIPHAPESDAYIEEFLRRAAVTVYHPTSTCKMGLESDTTAVVSPTLKVHGLNGLRVADASVFPTIVTGNTNAAAIMTGERVAEFIYKDWAL